MRRIAKIIGKEIPIYEVDVRDKEALSKVFDENHFDAVIQFAGLEAVCESVSKPLEYYHNNMIGSSDIATCYCNPAKAKTELGWEANYGIEEMCRYSWNWQRQNPNGSE